MLSPKRKLTGGGRDASNELGASDGLQRFSSYAEIRGNVDGIPYWVDRMRGLGNAVVPDVAAYMGRLLVAHAAKEG
jgi:hypothetical protein